MRTIYFKRKIISTMICLAIAWYVVPYKRANTNFPIRYPEMFDYKTELREAGGEWEHTEVAGDRAIFKVKASKRFIELMDTKFIRLPDDFMTNSLYKSIYFRPRKTPRYDKKTDTIILDGETQPLKSLENLDNNVRAIIDKYFFTIRNKSA